jgi:hypothetical protein
LLIESEVAGGILFLGTKHKLGHVAARPMVDALSMATLMRRMVGETHGYSPGANLEAQQRQLGAVESWGGALAQKYWRGRDVEAAV